VSQVPRPELPDDEPPELLELPELEPLELDPPDPELLELELP
jgi:hypothetical protein